MPVKPLKPKQRKGLTENQKTHLLNGWSLDSRDGRNPGFPFRDEDHRRELWFEHREELMANCLIPYKQRESFIDMNRGRLRPEGFWRYETREKPVYSREGYYKSELELLEKLKLVTQRDRELVREIQATENRP